MAQANPGVKRRSNGGPVERPRVRRRRLAWAAAGTVVAGLVSGWVGVAANGQATAPAEATSGPAPATRTTSTAPAAASGTKPAAAATLPASRPAFTATGRAYPTPVPADPSVLTDEMIDASIRKGADWLLKQFDPKTNTVADRHVPADKRQDRGDASYHGGLDALAVYALMQAGLSADVKGLDLKGPEMGAKIEALANFKLDGHDATYAYGLRATALALFLTHTPEFTAKNEKGSQLAAFKKTVRDRLKGDAAWCVTATDDGSYGYGKRKGTPRDEKELLAFYNKVKADYAKTRAFPETKEGYDNSNSQYGLLGAWSAAEAEVEIPSLYWYMVGIHWQREQLGSGMWNYGRKHDHPPGVNMTAAGLASMLVTHEYTEPALMTGSVGREPYNVPIKKGLAWFEQKDNAVSVGANDGYGVYGVERVGLASGYKFFGQHDWYRVLAGRIVKAQQADGHWDGNWGGPVGTTAYQLLFLARGRHPVVMNKLRFDGDAKTNPGYWSNRPRDAANLSEAIGRLLERPLNWQVVNVITPWHEWMDGPVLSLASHVPFKFSEEEVQKLRNYVEAGGLLYTQADGGAAAFDKFAQDLAKQLFAARKLELVTVPADHPIYSAEQVHKIVPPVPLKMVTNGSRILMLHSANDLSRYWQARDDRRAGKPAFQLGVNLFVYAAGKGDLRNRLQSAYVPEVPAKVPVAATVPVARASYNGPWDPEPGAWRRFANGFQWQTGYRVVPTPTRLEDLKPIPPAAKKNDPAVVRFAHLTGTYKQSWTAAQAAAAKAFVESGGVLLVDVTGGANAFDASAQELIRAAFPAGKLAPVPTDHPLLAKGEPGTEDLTRRAVRKVLLDRNLGRGYGPLQVLSAGKGAVVYSPIDVTSGLLGTNTGGIVGYEPVYATKLIGNAVLWAMDGVPNAGARTAAAGDESPTVGGSGSTGGKK